VTLLADRQRHEHTGSAVVRRGREELWEMLLDPAILQRCTPGCEAVELVRPHLYRIRLRLGTGLIKGSFEGLCELLDLDPPESYRLELEARGKTGSIRGSSAIRLVPLAGGEATVIEYRGTARLGGMLGALGAVFIRDGARSFFEEFIAALKRL
jgi:carbon monoxide dehydrogenase subunit G